MQSAPMTVLMLLDKSKTLTLSYSGASKKNVNMVKKLIFSCNLFQKVTLSYILKCKVKQLNLF